MAFILYANTLAVPVSPIAAPPKFLHRAILRSGLDTDAMDVSNDDNDVGMGSATPEVQELLKPQSTPSDESVRTVFLSLLAHARKLSEEKVSLL